MTSVDEQPDALWFEDLYRSEYPSMVRLARFLLGDGSAAEDVVQEAFRRIYRLDRPDRPVAYLRTAVVNGCHNWHRTRRRSDLKLLRHGVGDVAVSDRVRELDASLMRLPYRERAVIVLRYWLGMSEAEIADILGCRPGTVKSRHSRGLAKLRKEIT